jgi:hypothetical protein
MLTMSQRQAVTKELKLGYKRARKKKKSIILNDFCKLTGYNRVYAARILRTECVSHETKAIKVNKRKVIYDEEVLNTLIKIWIIADGICGKRIAPFLPELLDRLIQFKEIRVNKRVYGKLTKISASTIDRLLKNTKKKLALKGRSTTKPGTLLKHQIPIRTFSDWDESRAGFFEVDCVANCGDNTAGEYINVLNLTDVKTAWMEFEAVMGKGESRIIAAIENRRAACPIPFLGIDSDGGGEFINAHLNRYCIKKKLTFTRSRPYKKNDQNFIEQKNYSVIRRVLGYARFDTGQQLDLINRTLSLYRLYVNFFQPVDRLHEKIRNGARVTRKYKKALTPFQRVLLCPEINNDVKQKLSSIYAKLNPADLKRRIDSLRHKLDKSVK